MTSLLLSVAGVALVLVGAFLWSFPAGLAALGAFSLCVGLFVDVDS